MIEVEYPVDREDVAALVTFVMASRTPPEKRISGRVIAGIFTALPIYFFLDSVTAHELRWFAAGVALLIGAMIFATLPRLAALGHMREQTVSALLGPFAHQVGRHTLQLMDAGFKRTGPDGDHERAWPDVGRSAFTDRHIFIAPSMIEAFVVPLHALPNRESVVAFVKDKLTPARMGGEGSIDTHSDVP